MGQEHTIDRKEYSIFRNINNKEGYVFYNCMSCDAEIAYECDICGEIVFLDYYEYEHDRIRLGSEKTCKDCNEKIFDPEFCGYNNRVQKITYGCNKYGEISDSKVTKLLNEEDYEPLKAKKNSFSSDDIICENCDSNSKTNIWNNPRAGNLLE